MGEVKKHRLIDADALLVRIEDSARNAGFHNPDYHKIKRFIATSATIDAEPIRHGKWINKKRWSMGKWHKWLECSECKYQDYNLETYEAIPFTGPSNYCPNCGAKMDLEG